MNSRRSILAFLLCSAASMAAAQHYAITQEQIVGALAGGGLKVAPNQISLLAQPVARVIQPALKLKSIQQAGDHRMIARIECIRAAQCLPFLVAVRVEDDDSVRVASPTQQQTILVRAGSSATLLLEGTHVHISIPVICLDSGALGQVVRAANPDRSKLYTVQVAGDRLLRGTL